MEEATSDVIVIGAGLSGLRAAVDIHESGCSVIVLEAKDRVGGKTLSMDASALGGRIDLGAAWLNDTNQSEMYSLAKKFGYRLITQRDTGLKLQQRPDGSIVGKPLGPAARDPDDNGALRTVLRRLHGLVEAANVEYPHLGPDAMQLDSVTFLELMAQFSDSPKIAAAANTLAASLLGVEADEVSALYMVHYLKSGGGLQNMVSDRKNGNQYLRNSNGNQTFSLDLAAMLPAGSVKLLSPAKIIKQGTEHCVIETVEGLIYKSRRVIVSVPTVLYPSVTFEPALPLPKHDLSRSTVLGYYSKLVLVYDAPWWRDAGLSGVMESSAGPVSFTRDTCSEEDGQYSITCFLVGELGRRWSTLSDQDRRTQVLDQVRAVFGVGANASHIPEPVKVHEMEWAKEEWIRGAPCPLTPPGVLTSDAGKAIRDAFGRVHFVGTETSIDFKGYMEGAVRSGIRGAREVLQALGLDNVKAHGN